MNLQVIALAVVCGVLAEMPQTSASFFGGRGRFGPFGPQPRPVNPRPVPRPGGGSARAAEVLRAVQNDPAANAKYQRLMRSAPQSAIGVPIPCPCTTACAETVTPITTAPTIPPGATVCAVIFPPGGYDEISCASPGASCTEVLGCGPGVCTTGGTQTKVVVSACLLPSISISLDFVTVTTNCCCLEP